VKLKLLVVEELQYQYENKKVRRKNYTNLEEDKMNLFRKMTEIEMELQPVKAAKKKLKKIHREETRRRDKRDMIILASVEAL
jgi:hypothetical protein